MKDFLDRQPTKVGRRKLTYEDGTSEFVTVTMADEPTEEGTPLNREAFLALQGVDNSSTEISKADGVTTIKNTNAENEITITTISKSNGVTNIETAFTNKNGTTVRTITKITKANGKTSITKEVSA